MQIYRVDCNYTCLEALVCNGPSILCPRLTVPCFGLNWHWQATRVRQFDSGDKACVPVVLEQPIAPGRDADQALSPDSGALGPRPSGRATLRYVPVAFCTQHHTQSTSCHSCGPASKLAGCSCLFFPFSSLAWARQSAESVSANESPERNGPEPSTALPSPRSRALSPSRPSRYTSARVITSSTSTLCCEPVGPRHLPNVVPAGGLSTDG